MNLFAWLRQNLLPTANPITLRIRELKRKGLTEQETLEVVRAEFRLTFSKTSRMVERETYLPETHQESEEERVEIQRQLDAARSEFKQRLETDPVLKAGMESYRLERNAKARDARARRKRGESK